MCVNRWMTGLTVAAVLGMVLSACDGDGPRRAPSPTGPSPGPPAVRELRLTGPDSVAPGGSAQFTATAVFSDGSARDVTSEAAWRSSDEAVMAVASNGVATGRERGEVSLTVQFETRSAVKNSLMVLPPGTFKISGVVREDTVVLGDVRVTADGAGGPLSATTDRGTGAYRIYGVAGAVEITVSAPGYVTETERVQVNAHQTVNFVLTPAGARQTVEGSYHLTVTAADACTTLPPQTRVRHYTAVLTQRGIEVSGTLEDAVFYQEPWGRLNKFSGSVHPNRLRLRFAPPFDYVFYFPEIFEILSTSPPAYLALVGDVNTTASPDGYSGTLDGIVEFWTGPGRGFTRSVTCRSAEHRVVLTR